MISQNSILIKYKLNLYNISHFFVFMNSMLWNTKTNKSLGVLKLGEQNEF